MKCYEKRNNFIVYLLLVVFLITGAGFGLGEECQVFSSYHDVPSSVITVPTFTASNELHTFQVKERNSVTFRYNSLRNNRSEATLRGSLLFVCVLTILSVLFQLLQEIFVYFERLYVRDRYYIITFMHNTDGRKRIS